jgi:plastocyanin
MKNIVRIHKLTAGILLALAISTTQIALAAPPDATAAATEIKIDNFTFAPQTVTVKVGTKITWTNSDDIPHTVVSPRLSTLTRNFPSRPPSRVVIPIFAPFIPR